MGRSSLRGAGYEDGTGGWQGRALDKLAVAAKTPHLLMRTFLAQRFAAFARKLTGIRGLIPELGDEDQALLDAARGLSMTSPVAQWEFIQAVRHIERNNIPGDIVECGVWRGGNLVIAGLLRRRMGFDRRRSEE